MASFQFVANRLIVLQIGSYMGPVAGAPVGARRETGTSVVTSTALQKTAYLLLLALIVYAWVVGG